MIGRLLPGIDDADRLREAYAILRRSGLAGCGVALLGVAATRVPEIRSDAALCVMLATGWVMAMLGACLLVDVRGTLVTMRKDRRRRADPGMLVTNVIIALSVTGTGLLATGILLDGALAVAMTLDALGG